MSEIEISQWSIENNHTEFDRSLNSVNNIGAQPVPYMSTTSNRTTRANSKERTLTFTQRKRCLSMGWAIWSGRERLRIKKNIFSISLCTMFVVFYSNKRKKYKKKQNQNKNKKLHARLQKKKELAFVFLRTWDEFVGLFSLFSHLVEQYEGHTK